MVDRREQILLRLLAILNGMVQSTPPIVVTVVRNQDLRKDEDRPGLVLLDGDEFNSLSDNAKRGRRSGMAPQLMTMSPQVFILMNEQRPSRETIGPDTNALRIKIVNAVSSDEQLAALYGANGSIYLNTVTTDMKSGGAVTGSMLLDFRITYPLIPNE
jgi:hypothetical protein